MPTIPRRRLRLWRVNYTNPAAGIVPVSRTDVGQACGTYVDFAGNIGIVGTPVDRSGVADDVLRDADEGERHVRPAPARDRHSRRQREDRQPAGRSGERLGTGDGRDAQNNIAFNARTQNQRAGPAARSRHRLHRVGLVLRSGSVPRLDSRLRRGEPAAGDGVQHHAGWRPRRHLAVWRRTGGGFGRQPLRPDRQRFVQRRRRRDEISGTASSRSVRPARCSTGSRLTTGRS